MTGPRVAYILLWFPEPSQTFVLDEVNTLVRLGLDVRVYTLYGPRPPRRLAGMATPLAPVHHLGLRALPRLMQEWWGIRKRWGGGAPAFLRKALLRRWRSVETAGEALWAGLAGPHLARLCLADGIDHLHAPWANGPATAAWVASRFSGIPFSFAARAHDLYPQDGALREKIAAAALVRTNTESNRRYLTELIAGAAAKIVNVYNGVSLQPQEERHPAPGPPYRLLALGRLVQKKGFGVLVEACRLLLDRGVEVNLTIAGDGPERGRLEKLVQHHSLSRQVRLPGFVPHRAVPRLLAETHVFVMPSLIAPSGDRDGIPNVVLEALAHGVPVVGAAVSGIPEVVRPGETGWLAWPGDPRSLAQEIFAALSHPAEAAQRARQGQELIHREFDSRQNYARLKACFEAAVKGKAPVAEVRAS